LLYIGSNGNDPVTTAPSTIIFSDRALKIPLANPQTLNAFGESTNKIWIDGKYSLQVNNPNDVQKYQDLDAGETAESGITTLSNVQGTDTITAEASPTITKYVDKETYVFTAATTIIGPATLNIDGVGAQAIVKNHDKALASGDIEATEVIVVVYNESSTDFALVNQKSGGWEFVFPAATALNSATIQFTGLVAGFDYQVSMYGVQPVADGQLLVATVGVTGPTYRTANYQIISTSISETGSSAGNNHSGGWDLTDILQGNGLNETLISEITFFDPVAMADTYAISKGWMRDVTAAAYTVESAGLHTIAESHTAIRLQYGFGDIAIGEFKLFRRRNT